MANPITLAPKPTQEQRKAICEKCPRKGPMNVCKECGCFIPAKVTFLLSACPINKW